MQRGAMMFCRLLFKSLKELTPPLNKNRMPSFYSELNFTEKDRIFYVIRGVLFSTGVLMGLIFSWLHVNDYAPYYFTPYPSADKYVVDRGILSEVYIRQGQDYLILTKDDGVKIRLEEFSGFDDIQERDGVQTFQAKVWWFPLKYSSHGWIVKMETQEKMIVTEAEQQLLFNKMSQNLFDLNIISIFFFSALFAVIWEFILQYKLYKQGEK